MSQYFYKTTEPAALAAIAKINAEHQEFIRKCEALKEIFGGPGSSMSSGVYSYIGGVKIGYDAALDVHWKRPDQWGYRDLRSSPKIAKGTEAGEKAMIKLEHDRLVQLWKEHASVRVEKNGPWEAVGVGWGQLYISGGSYFGNGHTMYMTLGCAWPKGAIENVEEIMASEYHDAWEALKEGA